MAMFKFNKRDTVDKGEQDVLVAKLMIENEDTFHMKNLYKLIKEWLEEEGFADIYGVYGLDSVPEIFYLERLSPTGSKEHRIRWRCLKYPGGTDTYYRYFMKIDFLTLNMKSIEVMHQGYKMKTDRGDVLLNIESWLQLDYREEWGKDAFLKSPFVRRMFRNRVYKDKVEAHKVELYKITYRLQNIIKQYLKLKTLYDMPRQFHPERGL